MVDLGGQMERNASSFWPSVYRRNGFLRATSGAVLTTSVALGFWSTCQWIRRFCANGFKPDISKRKPPGGRPPGRHHLARDREYGVGWVGSSKAQLDVVRYADDLVATGASKDVLDGVWNSCQEKTRIANIMEGFDFLGRKHNGKLLIKPAKKSIKSLLGKIREIVKGNASAAQETLIRKLNLVIRGWAMHHRHVAAKATFSSIDSQVWQLLWKWAKRRHPAKGAQWARRGCFRQYGQRSWDFAAKRGAAENNSVGIRLFRAMTIAITRHVKIRGLANPFDPAWAPYFTHRRIVKCSVRLFGAALWR